MATKKTAAPKEDQIETAVEAATPAVEEEKPKRATRRGTSTKAKAEKAQEPETKPVSATEEEDEATLAASSKIKTLPQEKPKTEKKSSAKKADAEKSAAAEKKPATKTAAKKSAAKKKSTDKTLPPVVDEALINRTETGHGEFVKDAISRAKEREEYVAEKERKFAIISRLKELRNTHRIVSGRVMGVTPPDKGVQAIVDFEGTQTLIPYADMFVDSTLDAKPNESAERIARRQYQLLRKANGAMIDFVVEEFFDHPTSDGDYIIRGSRRKALLMQQKRNYIPRGSEPAVVQTGKTYPGMIIGVGRWGVRVCVMGVDTQIWAADMTFRPIENLEDMYHPGETVDVTVTNIGMNKNNVLTIKGSCKLPELEKYKKNMKRVIIGSTMMASVTNLAVGGNRPLSAQVFVDGFEVPGVAGKIVTDVTKEPLRNGTRVMFQIDGIVDDGTKVFGTIVRQVS